MRDIREKPEGREPEDVLTFPIRELYTHASELSEVGQIELENFIEAMSDIAIAIAKRKGDRLN